jgi:predicted nucleotidyltransferase
MREIICKRCGRPNQVSEEILQLPKCPQCENIKFTKDFFSPIAEQVKENFIRAKETEYGKILKRLYFFGSYTERNISECGDIDILFVYSKTRLKEAMRLEIKRFRSGECKIWDFNRCEEYPDCLYCFHSPKCKLPKEDYHSEVHTFCLEKCKNPKRASYPECLQYYCTFLDSEIRNATLETLGNMLGENVKQHETKEGFKVKVLDLVTTSSLKEFRETRSFTDFKPIRIL